MLLHNRFYFLWISGLLISSCTEFYSYEGCPVEELESMARAQLPDYSTIYGSRTVYYVSVECDDADSATATVTYQECGYSDYVGTICATKTATFHFSKNGDEWVLDGSG